MGPSILIGASLLFLFDLTYLLEIVDDITRRTTDLNSCIDCLFKQQQLMGNSTVNNSMETVLSHS